MSLKLVCSQKEMKIGYDGWNLDGGNGAFGRKGLLSDQKVVVDKLKIF